MSVKNENPVGLPVTDAQRRRARAQFGKIFKVSIHCVRTSCQRVDDIYPRVRGLSQLRSGLSKLLVPKVSPNLFGDLA